MDRSLEEPLQVGLHLWWHWQRSQPGRHRRRTWRRKRTQGTAEQTKGWEVPYFEATAEGSGLCSLPPSFALSSLYYHQLQAESRLISRKWFGCGLCGLASRLLATLSNTCCSATIVRMVLCHRAHKYIFLGLFTLPAFCRADAPCYTCVGSAFSALLQRKLLVK